MGREGRTRRLWRRPGRPGRPRNHPPHPAPAPTAPPETGRPSRRPRSTRAPRHLAPQSISGCVRFSDLCIALRVLSRRAPAGPDHGPRARKRAAVVLSPGFGPDTRVTRYALPLKRPRLGTERTHAPRSLAESGSRSRPAAVAGPRSASAEAPQIGDSGRGLRIARRPRVAYGPGRVARRRGRGTPCAGRRRVSTVDVTPKPRTVLSLEATINGGSIPWRGWVTRRTPCLTPPPGRRSPSHAAPHATPVTVPCWLQRALHREVGPAKGWRLSHSPISAEECGKPPARGANSHRSDGKVGQGVEKWDKVGYGGAEQTTGVAGLLPLRHSGLEPSRGP
jgi:hypothetical protein